MWQHEYGDGCEVLLDDPWCQICYQSGLALLAICFCSVSGCFSSTGGERVRTGPVRKLCASRCFRLQSFRGCGEKRLDNLCENHVFYSVCGLAQRVCESHVFYGVFGVAERGVWAGHVGESTSTGQSAPVSSLSLPPCPGQRPAVRRKPLNICFQDIYIEESQAPS